MIRTADPGSFEHYTPQSEAGGRILSLAQAYGVTQPFLRFWQGEYGSAIALMDGHAVLEADPRERDEVFIFLTMQPDIRSVRTDQDNARLLAALWPHSQLETGSVLTLRTLIHPTGPAAVIVSPRELYPILKAGFGHALPSMDSWYADVSYRMRHGVCRAAVVTEGDQPVSCAMTVAEWTGGAVLGAVSTLPEYRSRGYASACVSTLAAVLQEEGKQVAICPKNETARRLYERLGFVPCGGWGELCRHSAASAT